MIKKLIYHIFSEDDIISHFSLGDCKLLTPSFLAFIDLMCPADSDMTPVLLEITGTELDENQQNAIENTIRQHYRMQMIQLAGKLKSCITKTLWFLICTVLSSVFLYIDIITQQTDEVATQFYYIPMWFFGFRLILFPLQEYVPLHRELCSYRRLAAMKLVFSGETPSVVPGCIEDEPAAENAVYNDRVIDIIRDAKHAEQFKEVDGTLVFRFRTDSASSLMNPCSVPGNELISEKLAAFIDQVKSFINPDKPVELRICGCDFSEEEKSALSDAFINYSMLRYQQAIIELGAGFRRIISYALGLIASCILLYFWGKNAGLATHEFLLIIMWFFGDYLVEFILLGLSDSMYTVSLHRRLMNMKIYF